VARTPRIGAVDQPPVAVGGLGPGMPWIGLGAQPGGFDLVLGRGPAILATRPATRDDLLLAVLAYFSEGLEAPPAEFEATHGDVASVIRWLTEREPDARRRGALRDAIDAIDDGLAVDEVMTRLAVALPPELRDEPVAALRERATRLLSSRR
jgi:hypothetical protein